MLPIKRISVKNKEHDWAGKKIAAFRKQEDREKDMKYEKRMEADECIKKRALKKGEVFWLEDEEFGVKRAYEVEKVDRVEGIVVLRGRKNGDVKKIGILNKMFCPKK